MKRLEVKDYYSADIADLEDFSPDDVNNFYFHLEFNINEVSDERSSIFSVVVATPYSLNQRKINVKTSKTKFLVVNQFDWNEIKNKIKRITEDCQCDYSNIEVLLDYFNWEYE
ncbi:Imm8 family immunity protein [Listeria seeligeri]|uniref:Immunity protein 8 n=1 Tax=Listeria seeligeri TaxID=1640 RepID=A0A7X0X074_LISSE|nr:Imm8 family immunity protein [Listeria seeligeri]MBC1485199.1 hypothetical protein [Listeria seeligeri]MBF2543688.1 hypothetical protein [Listeria seeligeri]MBF2630544.1 hypothetical protein [Listeria seeligeri]MBF2642384.1 hypothetical protein [Listeria seeligeri]